MGRLKAIAFDKTRTLTRGEPVVSDVFTFDDLSPQEMLACAAGIETFSEHPIARSILSRAEAENIEPHPFENFEAVSGKDSRANAWSVSTATSAWGTSVCQQEHNAGKRFKAGAELRSRAKPPSSSAITRE
jgi:cation transport ATPase